jgi:hypothetical protein
MSKVVNIDKAIDMGKVININKALNINKAITIDKDKGKVINLFNNNEKLTNALKPSIFIVFGDLYPDGRLMSNSALQAYKREIDPCAYYLPIGGEEALYLITSMGWEPLLYV